MSAVLIELEPLLESPGTSDEVGNQVEPRPSRAMNEPRESRLPGYHFRVWSILLTGLAAICAGSALAETSRQATIPTGDDVRLRGGTAAASDWTGSDPLPLGVSVEALQRRARPPLSAMPAISSKFGMREDPMGLGARMHSGIDLPSQLGTPVHATLPGRVQSSGWFGGYGILVEIQHDNGVSTRYGHLSRSLVSAGESVPAGAIIGFVGSTGHSTGNHLHYEIRISGRAVNPLTGFGMVLLVSSFPEIPAYLPSELPSIAKRMFWSDPVATLQLPVAILH